MWGESKYGYGWCGWDGGASLIASIHLAASWPHYLFPWDISASEKQFSREYALEHCSFVVLTFHKQIYCTQDMRGGEGEERDTYIATYIARYTNS